MQSRGRGRGRGETSYRGGSPSYRGGRGSYSTNYSKSGNILAQIGDKKLIASNISGLNPGEIEEFNAWKILQKKEDTPSSSAIQPYVNKLKGKGKHDNFIENNEKRIIMLLNNSDKKWENTPWTIYDRYIIRYGYPMETYKSRLYYEIILSENGCEFRHFHAGKDQTSFTFSKIVIQRIVSMEDWGITPYLEKTVVYNKSPLKYNYFDYIQSFDKVFLYENEQKSHTWFIKLNSAILDHSLPTWVMKWWQFYGTSEKILPQLFKEYYDQWCKVIPTTTEELMTGYTQLWFFTEFSIPYIWKYVPCTGYTQENIFCLKGTSYTKFWDTMLNEDNTGTLACDYTITLLKEKIDQYTQQSRIQEARRLAQIASTPLKDEDVITMSKDEIIRHQVKYLQQLLKNKEMSEDEQASQKSDGDVSMASNNTSRQDINTYSLLQDSQEEETDDDILNEINKKLEEAANRAAARFIEGSSDSSGKGKGKQEDGV